MDRNHGERIRKRLEAIDVRLDAWRARAAERKTSASAELNERVKKLEEQRSRVGRLMARIGDSGEEAWEDVRDEAEDLLKKIRTGIQRLFDGDDDHISKA